MIITRLLLFISLTIINCACSNNNPQQRCEAAIQQYMKGIVGEGFEYKAVSFTFETFSDSADAIDRTPKRYRLRHKFAIKDPFGDKSYSEEEFVVTNSYRVLLRNGSLAD